jgi:hypothetical protein
MDRYNTALVAIAGLLFLTGLVTAGSDTAVFDVNVGSKTWIDINPNSTSWNALDPGNTSTIKSFELYNIGSANITSIYASNTVPSSYPFRNDNSDNFNAGNFLGLSSDNSTFYYANRVDFNESTDPAPSYIILPTNWVSYGRFRAADEELFWALVGGDSIDRTNCTNGTLYLSDWPHTQLWTGDVTLSSGTTVTLSVTSASWGAGDITLGNVSDTSFGETYCLVVPEDCTNVSVVRYNMGVMPYDAGGICSNDANFFSGQLGPGDETDMHVRAYVPYGVAAGNVAQGTLTVTTN